MASYKTTGIVVRRFNFGEADRIITFLTADRGKLKAVAKGVRRIKSRMAGHLEPFSTVELMLAEGKNLDIITSARLQRDVTPISSDQTALAYAYLFTELVDRLLEEGVPQPELYAGANDAFGALLRDGSRPLIELFFKLRLLDGLGYRPELSHCVVCHESDAGGEYFFVASLGGIVDRTCANERRHPMSISAIKFWRLLLRNPLADAERVPEAATLAVQTLAACDDFFEYHFGRRFAPLPIM